MFKRSAVLVLALLYLVTVSGFALNLHYCFNRLSSVNIDAPVKSCAKILQTSKMKCCKDTHFEVKVKDVHQAGLPSYLAKVFSFDIPRLFFAAFCAPVQKDLAQKLADRGPPLPSSGVTIFLKNCTFKI
jgi:hypothetical protein